MSTIGTPLRAGDLITAYQLATQFGQTPGWEAVRANRPNQRAFTGARVAPCSGNARIIMSWLVPTGYLGCHTREIWVNSDTLLLIRRITETEETPST